MAEEMQLTKLDVNMTPANVEVPNLDETVETVTAIVKKYADLPVASSTMRIAKSTRSNLNKLADQIKRTRIDTKKALLGNWDETEEKLKQLEESTKNASETINTQIKELEAKEKEDRREQINREIEKIADEYNFEASVNKFDDRWLNKSAKWKETEAAVREQFEDAKKERELHELRVSQVDAKAKELGIDSGGYIRLLHSEDLSFVLEKMEQDVKQREAELQARREAEAQMEQRHQEQLAEATQVGDKFIDNDTGEVIPEEIEVPRHDYNLVFRSITSNQANYLYNELENLLKPAGVIFEMKEM